MHQQREYSASTASLPLPIHLGAFLHMLRIRHGLSQSDILAHLAGWQQSAYSKVENDTRAPLFEQLEAIWQALIQAGVTVTAQDRQHFLLLARRKIESRKTRHERRSDADWEILQSRLARIDCASDEQPAGLAAHGSPWNRALQTPIYGIDHLLGRQEWLASLTDLIARQTVPKIVTVQGPPGSGKTSELHRLAHHCLQHMPRARVAFAEPAPIQVERLDPERVLAFLLGNILTAMGAASVSTTSLSVRIPYVFDCLARTAHPVVIFLDNGEQILDEWGNLPPLWQRFLTQFAQTRHQATLVLATQEWPTGTFLEETQLIVHTTIPELSRGEGAMLLQRLGLRDVAEDLLGRTVEAVGGIPLCLEWVVRLVQEPFLRNDWADFEEDVTSEVMLTRLLEDPALFGGAIARRMQPLLQRVLKHLSEEANAALHELTISPVPLGGPALKLLYHHPAVLKELREASLLVAYPKRVQLLPMVAALIRQRLTDGQIHAAEERIIGALTHWLLVGNCAEPEAGRIVCELFLLLLKHRRLLEAAELIIRAGWLAFHLGLAAQLGRAALGVCEQRAEQENETNQYGRVLLYYFMAPFAGITLDAGQREREYRALQQAVVEGRVVLQPLTEVYITRLLVVDAASDQRFDEAESILTACAIRMQPLVSQDADLQAALWDVQAFLCSGRSTALQRVGANDQAAEYRAQAIFRYQAGCDVLATQTSLSSLQTAFVKKRRARLLTNLGYQLDLVGRYEEAIPVLIQSIALKEQGYVEPGSLAASRGELSQAFAGVGRWEEALHFDALALAELEQLASAGEALARDERWVYLVNRAGLFLRLGRIDEAEEILSTTLQHIPRTRGAFRMQAETYAHEIEQWRAHAPGPFYQHDWRWVHRLRTAISFNSFFWLAHAGPFTPAEQQEWDRLRAQPLDEPLQHQLEALILQSRQRELAEALKQGREPRLWYPAIPLEEVRSRIRSLLQLDEEIQQKEPNEHIRLLYQETIRERAGFLRLIEAAATQNRERFREENDLLYPAPNQEEVAYLLAQIMRFVRLGMRHDQTRAASHEVLQLLREEYHLAADSGLNEEEEGGETAAPLTHDQPSPSISARTLQRFLEAALADNGCEGWQVLRDLNAKVPRVEAAARLLIIPDHAFSLDEVKLDILPNEVISHIGDAIVGERSVLGLLGIGTRNYMLVSEGRALYQEMKATAALGRAFDDSKVWLGPLAIALASGAIAQPQSFLAVFRFFEAFLFLYRLIRRPDQDEATARKSARILAETFCLRAFRGVPHLEQPGVYYSKDIVYLRGFLQVQKAAVEDPGILERLAVGRVALEYLPLVERLGVAPPLQPLRQLLQHSDLDTYILSFQERAEEHEKESQQSESTGV